MSMVILIPKVQNIRSSSDLRPINLLPTIVKLIEIFIREELLEFTKKEKTEF